MAAIDFRRFLETAAAANPDKYRELFTNGVLSPPESPATIAPPRITPPSFSGSGGLVPEAFSPQAVGIDLSTYQWLEPAPETAQWAAAYPNPVLTPPVITPPRFEGAGGLQSRPVITAPQFDGAGGLLPPRRVISAPEFAGEAGLLSSPQPSRPFITAPSFDGAGGLQPPRPVITAPAFNSAGGLDSPPPVAGLASAGLPVKPPRITLPTNKGGILETAFSPEAAGYLFDPSSSDRAFTTPAEGTSVEAFATPGWDSPFLTRGPTIGPAGGPLEPAKMLTGNQAAGDALRLPRWVAHYRMTPAPGYVPTEAAYDSFGAQSPRRYVRFVTEDEYDQIMALSNPPVNVLQAIIGDEIPVLAKAEDLLAKAFGSALGDTPIAMTMAPFDFIRGEEFGKTGKEVGRWIARTAVPTRPGEILLTMLPGGYGAGVFKVVTGAGGKELALTFLGSASADAVDALGERLGVPQEQRRALSVAAGAGAGVGSSFFGLPALDAAKGFGIDAVRGHLEYEMDPPPPASAPVFSPREQTLWWQRHVRDTYENAKMNGASHEEALLQVVKEGQRINSGPR